MTDGAMRILALATVLVPMTAPMTAAADGTEEGLGLVEMYCSDCHAIGRTGSSKLAGAPPFRELHLRYDVEFLSEALVEGIVTAHPDMPEFEFEPEQAEAIVRYLKSLEPAAP